LCYVLDILNFKRLFYSITVRRPGRAC